MAVVLFKMLRRCNKNAHTVIKISSIDRYYLERIKDLILTRLIKIHSSEYCKPLFASTLFRDLLAWDKLVRNDQFSRLNRSIPLLL